ncbi:MAG: 16S rRNA processing protein RimM [Lachnospiraceae bacterium]|nr:16S rRNA processing protein RimM [Lachnospiraceae bacterium]
MEEMLRIGVVTSPHGVRGEVKVYPTTDDPDRFKQIGSLVAETPRGSFPMDVENVKYFKNMVILKLSGIHTMDEAEQYRNADLLIRRSQSAPLRENEYFIGDLLDMDVYLSDGTRFGTLTDVLKTSGANDVYEITKEDGGTVLIPMIPDVVKAVDVSARRMTVELLPGLEDL